MCQTIWSFQGRFDKTDEEMAPVLLQSAAACQTLLVKICSISLLMIRLVLESSFPFRCIMGNIWIKKIPPGALVSPLAWELQVWMICYLFSPLWQSFFLPKLIFNDTVCYVGPQGAFSGCALITQVTLLVPIWEGFIKGSERKRKHSEFPYLSQF